MARFAFLSVAAHGHVSPTLGVVQELIGRGHDVDYLTTEEFAGPLTAVGAKVHRYKVPGGPQQAPPAFADNDPSALPMFFLPGSGDRLKLAEAALTGSPPDVVVYDNTSPFVGRALARRTGARAVQFFPTFASSRGFALMDAMLARTGRSPVHEANLAEFDSALRKFLADTGLHNVTPEEFMDFEERLNLVFLPRSFQLAADTFGDHYRFVGPNTAGRAAQGKWTPTGERPVVLVSLGTVFNRAPEFFRAAIAGLADQEVQLVLSIGTHVDPTELGPLPRDCEVHATVPQLAVLDHAAAAVCHGGMGSTMEAIASRVPLVLVPRMVEQEVIADRVAELGLGVRLDRAGATADRIGEAVQFVRTDADVATAVADAARSVAEAGGASAAADALEDYLSQEAV